MLGFPCGGRVNAFSTARVRTAALSCSASWFRSTACTIILRQLKRSAIAAAVNCQPTGLHPAAPFLSALPYHVSPCFNLLYSTFYIFF